MGEEKKEIRPHPTAKHKPVTKEVLVRWRQNMAYDVRDAAHEMGCTQAEWRAWESGEVKIPRHVGLACAALAMGMNTYGEHQG